MALFTDPNTLSPVQRVAATIGQSSDPYVNLGRALGLMSAVTFGGAQTSSPYEQEIAFMQEFGQGVDWTDPTSIKKLSSMASDYGLTDLSGKLMEESFSLSKELAKVAASAGGKAKDIPQPTDISLSRIQEQLDKKFDFGEGLWGLFDLGQDVSPAWEGYDRVGMSDWVFGYAQKFNIDPQTVINKIAKGELKPENIGTGYTAPTGGAALTRPAPPAPEFKY